MLGKVTTKIKSRTISINYITILRSVLDEMLVSLGKISKKED